MKPAILSALTTCALVLTSPALADGHEGCLDGFRDACPAYEYGMMRKDDACAKCRPAGEPPGPAETVCHRAGNDYFCEAWPQGPELTYTWTSGGSVTLLVNGSTASTLQGIFCNGLGTGGWVQLTVTSPFGLTSMQDLAIECTPTGSGY